MRELTKEERHKVYKRALWKSRRKPDSWNMNICGTIYGVILELFPQCSSSGALSMIMYEADRYFPEFDCFVPKHITRTGQIWHWDGLVKDYAERKKVRTTILEFCVEMTKP